MCLDAAYNRCEMTRTRHTRSIHFDRFIKGTKCGIQSQAEIITFKTPQFFFFYVASHCSLQSLTASSCEPLLTRTSKTLCIINKNKKRIHSYIKTPFALARRIYGLIRLFIFYALELIREEIIMRGCAAHNLLCTI